MPIKFLFFLCVTALILSSCGAGIKTSSWKANGVNLKDYQSYAWIAPGDSTLGHRRDDKLYAGTIQHFADEELKNKGFKVDNQNPQAVFMFDTRLEDHVRYTQSPTVGVGVAVVGNPGYYGAPSYYMGGMIPVAGGDVTTSYYKQGTLIIEMYDLKTSKLLWKGWASKDIDETTDVNYLLQKAIHDIFFYLPVKHKTN